MEIELINYIKKNTNVIFVCTKNIPQKKERSAKKRTFRKKKNVPQKKRTFRKKINKQKNKKNKNKKNK